MNIIHQKTSSVIKRVNEMMNPTVKEVFSKTKKDSVETVPELVIVPVHPVKTEEEELIRPMFNFNSSLDDFVANEFVQPKVEKVEEPVNDILSLDDDDLDFEDTDDFVLDEDVDSVEKENLGFTISSETTSNEDLNLFETVTPFEEPSLFVNKLDDTNTDNSLLNTDFVNSLDFNNFEIAKVEKDESLLADDVSEEMPEVVWVTHEEEKAEEDDNLYEQPSFDEQINALLSFENNDNGKTRKKVA